MENNHLLQAFLPDSHAYEVELFGSGLIHKTFIVRKGEIPLFILQEVNTQVFRTPYNISFNLDQLSQFLKQKNAPVFFPLPMSTLDGKPYVIDHDRYFRLTPFVEGSHTVDFCTAPEQAYEAAMQFGKFTAAFDGFQVDVLKDTIPQFHDLDFRWQQFMQALQDGNKQRIAFAKKEIDQIQQHVAIVKTYNKIKSSSLFRKRVTHHDTKINNVLFNGSGKGVAVIDLDTVMSGYFISDVGDMCRTYLSPGNEEEKDLSSVFVRKEFYQAITEGYLESMADQMSHDELSLLNYSGQFMIYMQALRFLTDFLNDDIYYGIKYEMNNFDRTVNQLVLLEDFIKATS